MVSIDTKGCEYTIVEKIIVNAINYLLAVKGNQPNLHQTIQAVFLDRKDQKSISNRWNSGTTVSLFSAARHRYRIGKWLASQSVQRPH